MEKSSRKKILVLSSGWVAVVLNLLPGLGTGYIYQRRWKAYWFTGLASSIWVIAVAILQSGVDSMDPMPVGDSLGIYGLFVISVLTSCEAGLTVKNARQTLEEI